MFKIQQAKPRPHAGTMRGGNTGLTVLGTVAAFSVVLGAAWFVMAPGEQPVVQSEPVVETPEPIVPLETKADTATAVRSASPVETNSEPVAVVQTAPEVVEPQAPTPAEQVEAHLAAGEFGLADEVAQTIADIKSRDLLLRRIADVQVEAGEFAAAGDAIGRITLPGVRGQAESIRQTEETLAGGGSQANFSEILQLIQTATSGPWAPDDPEKTVTPFGMVSGGISVDPLGQLALVSRADTKNRLAQLGRRARRADLNEDMAQASNLRIVSLKRLEREVASRLNRSEAVLNTMQHLAGLSRVQFVFLDTENQDVLIGGPAEAWKYDEFGRAVGVDSGRPMLHLDDLVTVLRVFSPAGSSIFRCSIDPRPEGMQKLKEVVERSNARGSLSAGAGVRSFVRKCGEALGPQDTVFAGVPDSSRVARVMLEADYKMKLIGIDKLDAGSQIPSFFDLLDAKTVQQNPPSLDALRWWLTMKYDAVLHDPNRQVFEFQGSSVLCRSENELVTADGERIHTGESTATNSQFAQKFTANYSQLAQREPVFADLQNIFDLALVAALVQHENLVSYPQGYGVFAPNGQYQPQEFAVPKTVDTVVNHRVYGGRDVIVQVAGGVRADLASVLRDQSVYRVAERLTGLTTKLDTQAVPDGRWWWDAK